MGRYNEALTAIKRAHELDPLSRIIGYVLAQVYLLKNDVMACLEQAKKSIDLEDIIEGLNEIIGA